MVLSIMTHQLPVSFSLSPVALFHLHTIRPNRQMILQRLARIAPLPPPASGGGESHKQFLKFYVGYFRCNYTAFNTSATGLRGFLKYGWADLPTAITDISTSFSGMPSIDFTFAVSRMPMMRVSQP